MATAEEAAPPEAALAPAAPVPLQFGAPEDFASLPFKVPASLDEVDATWMNELLHYRGTIAADASVASIEKADVGLTAGHFSAIAKVTVKYSEGVPDGTPTRFVIKTWPPLELVPAEAIKAMFLNDIAGYANHREGEYYPRIGPLYLATYDDENNKFCLVMTDANEIGTHKSHENSVRDRTVPTSRTHSRAPQ